MADDEEEEEDTVEVREEEDEEKVVEVVVAVWETICYRYTGSQSRVAIKKITVRRSQKIWWLVRSFSSLLKNFGSRATTLPP